MNVKPIKSRTDRKGGNFFNNFAALMVFFVSGVLAVLSYTVNMNALGWQSNSLNGSLAVPITEVFSSKSPTVLLYASPDTAKYLKSVGGNYEVLLKPWRNFFTQQKINYKEITHIDKVDDPGRTVLVLPSLVAIGEVQRAAITSYQRRGGNILATSTLGARDESGDWVGYNFVKTLFGVSIDGEVLPDKEERYLNLFGDLPFSQSYKIAERIWLGKMGTNPLRLTGGKSAGTLTDWARTSSENNDATAAVLYDELGHDKNNARWVMLSFSETSWEIQHNAVHAMLSNALAWLEHRTVVYKAAWPFPYRAAQIIEMDTEEGFPNARRFAAMMDKIDAPSTFFMLTSVARRYPEIVKALANRHEIAYHGDVHDGFKGQPEQVQAQRFTNMQSDMKAILGNLNGITSFRAPLESYDKTTENLLLKNKLRVHAADPNRSDGREPFFSPDDKLNRSQAIIVLPRTQFDDLNLIKAGKNDKTKITESLINDFNQIYQMGALGILSIHSQNFEENHPLTSAMPDYLDHVSKENKNVWVTTAKNLSSWWEERDRFAYKVTERGAKTDLDVTLDGQKPMRPKTLILTNPFARAQLQLKPARSNMALPSTKMIDDFRTAIIFSDMEPGSYSYSFTFIKD